MKAILAAMAMAAVLSSPALAGAGWMKDYDAALAKAKKERKPVLIQFTGQQWCSLCVILDRKIFSKKEFLDRASKNWVLLELDLTRGNIQKMPADKRTMYERNRALVKQY